MSSLVFEHALKHIGAHLHRIRIERQEKQINVARAVNISIPTLSKIESGHYKQLSLKKLHDLAGYYNITIASIIGDII